MTAFSVSEIWRYPVKSMQGERLDAAEVTGNGVQYDRGWAVRDTASGNIRGAKNIAPLMQCAARYLDGTDAGLVPHAQITLPGGDEINTDDGRVHNILSEVLGQKVTLEPLQPAAAEDHYRRRSMDGDGDGDAAEPERRRRLGLLDDEPFSDFSTDRPRVLSALAVFRDYNTAPGTYFDAFALHVMTEASLRYLAGLLPEAQIDVRRFRPNILLADDGDLAAPVEFDWLDQVLSIGDVRINVEWETVRCVMTTREHADLPRASQIMRTLVRNTKQNLGIYADVGTPGLISVGDVAAVG
ncbi:MAG: MOSC domain-containing protein [Rhodospirillaceae bacterium]|jgi:hypothetical protein|nr:MOSC domain-containing protein [Rhodospirillaceae bacterium]MBT4042453.1 MOSC domain-containing protein [Rhodospirillaceae bacterium]MBT4687206.1 MOSC domain-containing protein [Rhodospirillaceae bacterium]MBT5082763.1 MOSC domain-containing protein [Rhodospirillaceae bacterium]MBT5524073.1 MOSC domain-containing protein [Rhodospirillaceae bacterium]